jgi:hypothetical protein
MRPPPVAAPAGHLLMVIAAVMAVVSFPGGVLAPSALAAQDGAPERVQERDRVGESITVTGRVVDALTGTPLPAAQVRFRAAPPEADETPEARQAREGRDSPPDEPLRPRDALSDGDGRFQLDDVAVGLYLFSVESLGYRVVERQVRVMGASPFDIQVQLAPEALALEGVVVTLARSPKLASAGFYERMAIGQGTFVTRQQIEARAPLRTSDLFRSMAGVQVRPSGRGDANVLTLRGGCRPDIVIDGMNLGPNLSVDEVLLPSDLEAVEVFRVAGAPPQFSRSTCGVVLLWSADPATRRGDRPFSWRRLAVAGIFVVLALVLTR